MKKIDKWVNYAGEICVSKKDPNERYVKIVNDFEVLAGNFINYKSYKQYLSDKKTSGNMTEEEMNEKLKRNWVKGVLTIPPQIEKPDVQQFPDSGTWINDAIEIRVRDNGTIYIMVRKDFKITANSTIRLVDAVSNIENLFSQGKIDEDKRNRMINGISMKDDDGNPIPNKYWLRYKGSIPPKK